MNSAWIPVIILKRKSHVHGSVADPGFPIGGAIFFTGNGDGVNCTKNPPGAYFNSEKMY